MAYPYEPEITPPTLTLTDLVVTPPDVDYTFHELVTAPFAVPAPLGTVAVAVEDSTRYAAGMPLYFAGYGIFLVSSLLSPTSIAVESLTATTGVTVPIGVPFNSCARPAEVTAAEANPIYDTLSAAITIPALGAPVTIDVVNGGWFVLSGILFIEAAGWYQITDPYNGSDKSCIAVKLYDDGSPATGTVSAGATVLAVGELPYAPDGDTIITSNATGLPGGGRFAVDPRFPQTPNEDKVIIQTGITAKHAGYYSRVRLPAITFSTAFVSAPFVTATPFLPNTPCDYCLVKVSALSNTGMTLDVYANGMTPPDSQVMWTAIGV